MKIKELDNITILCNNCYGYYIFSNCCGEHVDSGRCSLCGKYCKTHLCELCEGDGEIIYEKNQTVTIYVNNSTKENIKKTV